MNLIRMENSIMSRNDIKTIMLSWAEVSEAISACVYAELGRSIICEAQFLDDTYWSVLLKNYRISPAEIYAFLSQTGFPIADWQDTLSDEGGPVTEFGILFSEHLLSRQLKLTWTHRVIAEEGLWLVDVHSTGEETDNG